MIRMNTSKGEWCALFKRDVEKYTDSFFRYDQGQDNGGGDNGGGDGGGGYGGDDGGGGGDDGGGGDF